jgi:hypothetical protein
MKNSRISGRALMALIKLRSFALLIRRVRKWKAG